MFAVITDLFLWMPVPLRIACGGVMSLFLLSIILHIWSFIKDLIPFL